MTTKIEHNATTGEITERQMTSDELANIETIKLNNKNAAIEAKAKEAARQALLDKLGITADEAKLLLG